MARQPVARWLTCKEQEIEPLEPDEPLFLRDVPTPCRFGRPAMRELKEISGGKSP